MKRSLTFLVLLVGTLTASSAAAQGYDFRGLKLGMDPHAFVAAVSSNGWTIPSYTAADGRVYSRAIEYQGLPTLDTLVDEVVVETEGLKLDCAEPTALCAETPTLRARFRFGVLQALELTSVNGQEKVFRPYALAALKELTPKLGRADREESDVQAFFTTYNIDKVKTFAEIPLATWRVETKGAAPVAARCYVIRLTEKYDYFREEKGVYTPWGACRVEVKLDEPEVEQRWAALKTELKQRAAR